MKTFPIRLRRGGGPALAIRLAGFVVLGLLAIYGSTLAQFRVGQIADALILALAIIGLNLATGYTGQLSIGHSAFFGLGAYVTGILINESHWPALGTIPIAALACFALGLLTGLPALRIRGINLALVTLALGVAFPEVVDRYQGLTGGTLGLNISFGALLPPAFTHLGFIDRNLYLYWLTIVILVVVQLLVANLVRSRAGLAMMATRDHEVAASAFGVNLALVKTVVFGLSAAITGIAGSLFALYLGTLSADQSFTLLLSISLITGLVIGGVSTLAGPIIGGFAVVFIPYFSENIRQGQASGLLFGAILIVLMFVMPKGLIGLFTRLSRRLLVIESSYVSTDSADFDTGARSADESLDLGVPRVEAEGPVPTAKRGELEGGRP